MFEAFGMHRPAQFARALSGSHNIAARQAELTARMDKFSGGRGKPGEEPSDDLGFKVSGDTRMDLLDAYGGDHAARPEEFRQAYDTMSPLLETHGITPSVFALQYPQHAGLMASIYASERDSIDKSPDPLADLASRAGAPKDLFGL
jgi:hypothetical protein